jgi:hypothetical protein
MNGKRTIYNVGGGEIVSVDEIDVEDVVLVGGLHDGRITMVGCLEDEIIIPGDQTCIYRRGEKGQFIFDHYLEGLQA